MAQIRGSTDIMDASIPGSKLEVPVPTIAALASAQVVWESPGPEVSQKIEIAASLVDAVSDPLSPGSSNADVQVTVTDNAADAEPSHTATLTVALAPIGVILAGAGSARIVIRASSNGQFAIAVTEPTATVKRYLWVLQGGSSQFFVKARDGVIELDFT